MTYDVNKFETSELGGIKNGNKEDMKKSVFGIYGTIVQAEDGVRRLMTEGFASSSISVLLPQKSGTAALGDEKSTKAPEGAATGASAGVILGGTLGWLVGVGALAIPGVGPFIAAGPLMAILAGAGAGAAVGGVTGSLVGMGIPEYQAKLLENTVRDGGILLSVHTGTDERIEKAKMCLKETDAMDISVTSEAGTPSNKDFPHKPSPDIHIVPTTMF